MRRRDWVAGAGLQALAAGAYSDERRLRVGVVGGRMGAKFQWSLHPRSEVVAVCDTVPAQLDELVRSYGCKNAYREYSEFLRHPGMDAVALFTPFPSHAAMSMEAMSTNRHVLCGEPAGLSVEELERLLECVKRTGLTYMMAATARFRASVLTCIDWRREGRFGVLYHSEAEYHHQGIVPFMFESDGSKGWRYGLPPMFYPTSCTGAIVPVTGERLVEVQAVGWGDGHAILRDNPYRNPFWNETAFFKTSGGHSARVSIGWRVAAGKTERASFYGTRQSYFMARPEKAPESVVRVGEGGTDPVRADPVIESFTPPPLWERLPEPLRSPSGHGGSHAFITDEFVGAVLDRRAPVVDIYEAIAYTLPGLIAHQSALRGVESMRLKDYGRASGV